MELIKQSYEIFEQDFNLKAVFRQIEAAGRICYKSVGTRYFRLKNDTKNAKYMALMPKLFQDSNVVLKSGPFFDKAYYLSIKNEDVKKYPELSEFEEENFEDSALYENLSAEQFVNNLIKSGHNSMLEHGTVYLYSNRDFSTWKHLVERYSENEFSILKSGLADYDCYVTTNFRVLVENEWLDDLAYLCEPTSFHEKRYTVKFTTDIGIVREFLRHRKFSFANESTRYCNYSKKNKFSNNVTFIEPLWYEDAESFVKNEFNKTLAYMEDYYLFLINKGFKPQDARCVLPLATKSDLVMTGFSSDWEFLFNLRVLGTTGAPHPQIKALTEPLMNEFIEKGYIKKLV